MGINNGLMFSNNPSNFIGPTANGASGQILLAQGTTTVPLAPIWSPISGALTAPTVQRLTSTGSTAGALFQVTTGASAALGAVYGNNGATYLVSAAFNGVTFLFTSGTNFAAALSGATLQLLSGTGSSGIGFTLPLTLAQYTTPSAPSPLYLKVILAGGGGGGGGGGSGPSTGQSGTISIFGSNLLIAGGGAGGNGLAAFGVGGSNMISAGPVVLYNLLGQAGGGGSSAGSTGDTQGGAGGSTPRIGGGGAAGAAGTVGGSGTTNTGGGGGGGGDNGSSLNSGAGGGSGGYVEVFISSPSSTYQYAIGTGGAAGTASANNGGTGGSGVLVVEEHYQ